MNLQAEARRRRVAAGLVAAVGGFAALAWLIVSPVSHEWLFQHTVPGAIPTAPVGVAAQDQAAGITADDQQSQHAARPASSPSVEPTTIAAILPDGPLLTGKSPKNAVNKKSKLRRSAPIVAEIGR